MSDLFATGAQSPGKSLSAGFRKKTGKSSTGTVFHLQLRKKSTRAVLTWRIDMLNRQTVTGFLVGKSCQFLKERYVPKHASYIIYLRCKCTSIGLFPRISKEHTHIIEAKARRHKTLDYSRSSALCYSKQAQVFNAVADRAMTGRLCDLIGYVIAGILTSPLYKSSEPTDTANIQSDPCC